MPNLGDLFRSVFGIPKFDDFSNSDTTDFGRDPFWDLSRDVGGENWDDVEGGEQSEFGGIFDSRSPFSEPFEMLRRFEEMFQHFGFTDYPPTTRHGGLPALPEAESDSIRDKMLKHPDSDKPKEGETWDYSRGVSPPTPSRRDEDLDEQIASGKLQEILEPHTGGFQVPPDNKSFFYNSVTIKKVQLPDGRIEEQRVVRDSEGNEETIVRRAIGEQQHLVKKKSSNDVVVTEEEFVNIDEKTLEEFEKKWKQPKDRSSLPTITDVTDQPSASSAGPLGFIQRFFGYGR